MKRLLYASLVLAAACGDDSPGGPDPDVVAPEDVSEDAGEDVPDTGGDADVYTGPPALADLGEACTSNEQCISGYCIEGTKGSICTQECVASCPNGWLCKGVGNPGGSDLLFLCAPASATLCHACTKDVQCQDGRCADIDGGSCTVPCKSSLDCPGSYACTEIPALDGSGPFMGCIPHNGTCTCDPSSSGLQRSCKVKTALGTCTGFETCLPEQGWIECTAKTPVAEECNGEDDDCNGLVDDALAGTKTCEVTTPGVGTCTGKAICVGSWVCQAPQPKAESCDYVDNDCDGSIDEDFQTDGVYANDAHCGACEKSCDKVIAHGTGACKVSTGVAKCVVVTCDPGFTKINDLQCLPDVQALCQACETDAQCVAGGGCIPLDDGNYCTKSCLTEPECPDGFGCQDGACIPDTGSCSCDGTNLSLKRTCEKSTGGGGTPAVTCTGIETCTPTGWSGCQLPTDVCDGQDNDCDGDVDEGFLVGGKYASDEHCGSCANNCAGISFTNAKGYCDTTKAVPDCEMVCNQGTFDTNDNPKDGCECLYQGELDLPGGTDANCDGVDGETQNAIFVAKDGLDTNAGTQDSPVLSLTAALLLAQQKKIRDVYVATGVYLESIALLPGIALYGGYSADFSLRDPKAYETALLGDEPTLALPGAVNAVGIKGGVPGDTRFDGFTIFGSDAFLTGSSSYGVYVKDCDATLALVDLHVLAGNGGDGSDGASGAHGTPGAGGQDGVAAKDIGHAECITLDTNAGGAGGAGACSALDVTGGDGGTAICPDFDDSKEQPVSDPVTQTSAKVESGEPGKLAAGPWGKGGLPGLDSSLNFSPSECAYCIPFPNATDKTSAGQTGGDGVPGDLGAPGSPCASPGGSIKAGLWQGDLSQNGGDGVPGGGGGGGGAGGGVESVGCEGKVAKYSDVGGSGGGGGAGGCGGGGGKGGTAGGGSFAIFVVFTAPPQSLPAISGNLLRRGYGGHGGHGGPAGVGGAGGAGGLGGVGGKLPVATSPDWCAPPGGAGGDGGPGGHGGGGGGGCGGVSYGLFVSGAGAQGLAAYKGGANAVEPGGSAGAGGPGGSSLGTGGKPGLAGAEGEFNF